MSRRLSSPARLLLLSLSPKFFQVEFLQVLPPLRVFLQPPSQEDPVVPPLHTALCQMHRSPVVRLSHNTLLIVLWTELAWDSQPSALTLSPTRSPLSCIVCSLIFTLKVFTVKAKIISSPPTFSQSCVSILVTGPPSPSARPVGFHHPSTSHPASLLSLGHHFLPHSPLPPPWWRPL